MTDAVRELESLPRADRHRPRGTPGAPRRFKWRALAWLAVHALVLVHVAHWKVSGTTLSPVEPSEAGEIVGRSASGQWEELGYVNAGFLLFALLVLATLVLGRFFCGWACHVVAYQDASAWLLRKLGLQPKPVRSRLLMLVPAFAALEMFVFPLAARFAAGHGFPELALRLSTGDLWARFPGPWIAALTFLVDGALVVWLLGAKGFCTYACPYGAIFGVADRFAPGRIRVTDACEGCGHCTAVCTSNVRVHDEVARFRAVVDPNCMKCMDCVAACPKDALYFGFRARSERPAASVPRRQVRPRRTWDFTWPEEVALVLVFAGSLWAWRGLYGAIPFLLALGLAVISAFASVALWRTFTRRELVVQHWVLRRAGRVTPAGGTALLGFGALLALTAHGALWQWRNDRAEDALLAAGALPANDPERARLVARAEGDIAWLLRFGLADTADLLNKQASIAYARGDLDAAERSLARALELDPELSAARLRLADVYARRGAWDSALDELEAVLAREPANAEVAEVERRLAALAQREPANARARDLLERARGGR